MYELYAKFLLYRDLGEDDILEKLSQSCKDWHDKTEDNAVLISRIFTQVKRLLELATKYGFNENLWQNYLTFIIMTNENPFSLSCERIGRQDGSINLFAKQDMMLFWNLFHYDFTEMERDLDINCFKILQNYRALPNKKEKSYHKYISETVQTFSRRLAMAESAEDFFHLVSLHYKQVGVGLFGLNRAFRVQSNEQTARVFPVFNTDTGTLADLVGYDLQKAKLRENTEAFLDEKPCNNVLLYGDSGTGKSSSVKALLTEYHERGLRIIELYKHQFKDLSAVIAQIKDRNYRFIIFIDDLSFEENEVEYKFLKAVIEGGVETKPDNILIYATSNRRNLIRETWNDRQDMELQGDIHRSDTMEEKLSLSSRFGVQINYNVPNRSEYKTIIKELAKRQGIELQEEDLYAQAIRWELRHGGASGRTAQQFLNHLAGQP